MLNNEAKIFNGLTTPALVAAIFFFAVSCIPDPLEVDSVPQVKVEIVVSSQIIPDQSLVVMLTKTFGALDGSDESDPAELLDLIAVNDAVITIQGPDGLDTLSFLGRGIYGGVFISFREGQSYQLNVNSRELGAVYAVTEVKPKVDFTDIDAELFYNGFNDTLAQVTYTFNDAPEKNWYMVNVQEVEREDLMENLLNPRAFTFVIPDDDFNGDAYTERFRVFPRDYQPGDTIAVSLSNISEEYYRFIKLRIDNRLSLVEFVSEPVNYPSNVVGGKGYFNLYVPDVEFFVFE
jgi:hypothetical protein